MLIFTVLALIASYLVLAYLFLGYKISRITQICFVVSTILVLLSDLIKYLKL